jgi:CRP/FNR family transcriptional regulator
MFTVPRTNDDQPESAIDSLARNHAAFIDEAQILRRHFAHAASRKLLAGAKLWSEGEERSHVYLVRSGAISLSRVLPDGRRVVIGFAYPGDMVGLGSEIHGVDADAIQDARLEALPIAAFQRAATEDADFARIVRSEVSHALRSAHNHVMVVCKLTAAERVAHFLVELSERNARRGNSPSSVVLPMRRIDIADFLGLTIETVSRTFTAFRKGGLIAMDQPSVVFLKGLRKLASLASGNSDGANDAVFLRKAA